MKTLIIRIVTSSILTLIFFYIFLYANPAATSLSALSILLYILIFEWPKLFNSQKPLFWLIMPFYPILPFALIAYMCLFWKYKILIFYMVLLTASHDTGGYLIGSLIGKHKLAHSISPRKSWEGFFGGYTFVLATLLLILFMQNANPSTIFIFSFSLAISILATIGDLFESCLKRKAKIKDTGTILPGHGGFLDRIDSYLAVIFLFFVMRNYLVNIFKI